jgi:hypothetical protein
LDVAIFVLNGHALGKEVVEDLGGSLVVLGVSLELLVALLELSDPIEAVLEGLLLERGFFVICSLLCYCPSALGSNLEH